MIGFLPWIGYALVATSSAWHYGALVGLLIAAAVLFVERRAGRAWDELVIPASAVVFFVLAAGFSLVFAASPAVRCGPALVDAWLALTAGGSLLVGRPFTLAIARRRAPSQVWGRPEFRRANMVLTAVWAAAFALAAAALAVLLHDAPTATGWVLAIKIAGFAAPAAFTCWYAQRMAIRFRAGA
ncbi:hypothetical protein ABT337_12200 [Saccharopolyspora hirsuta]|uniref:hypothetical protein n=1 Tax=Saccharopolyspora hirsuta TaxID=1837 RepID=UPI00332580BC